MSPLGACGELKKKKKTHGTDLLPAVGPTDVSVSKLTALFGTQIATSACGEWHPPTYLVESDSPDRQTAPLHRPMSHCRCREDNRYVLGLCANPEFEQKTKKTIFHVYR